MKQRIIKKGDLVKMIHDNPRLHELGFVIGRVYLVVEGPDKSLEVQSIHNHEDFRVPLFMNGDFTDWSDFFTKHKCPVARTPALPRGVIW